MEGFVHIHATSNKQWCPNVLTVRRKSSMLSYAVLFGEKVWIYPAFISDFHGQSLFEHILPIYAPFQGKDKLINPTFV